ncbi:MAG: copper resistance protein CopC [Candidatus Limnocylindria bacterium]
MTATGPPVALRRHHPGRTVYSGAPAAQLPASCPRRLVPINRSSIVSLAAALLIGSLVAPAPTLAHAELVSADPLPNASMVDAPTSLSITFSEPIDPDRVTLELVDVQLRPQDGIGTPMVDAAGTGLTADLPNLDPDVYTVRYAVVSTIDGHATTGFYAFSVDPTGTQAPPTEQPASESPSTDGWAIAARWLALLAALVSLGSLISWWHVGRSARLRPAWGLIGVTALLSTAALAVYLVLSARTIPPGTAGGGWSLDIVGPYGWTPFAIAVRVALLAGLAAGICAVIVGAMRSVAPTIFVVGVTGLGALALAGMSAAGHAASLGGPLNIGLDWLHLLAVAAWLGGLPALLLMARAPSFDGAPIHDRRRDLLRRHGRLALLAAPLVVLTGLANSPLVLGSARGLVASEYGNLLLAKATLASVAIGIGAANHLLLRGRGRGHIARLIGAELLVAAVAVMTAAAMVTIQPAAARQDVVVGPAIQPAHFFGEAGPSSIHASISVPSTGVQGYQVTVRDAATGGPRNDLQRVFLAFTGPPETGLDTVRVDLEPNEIQGLFTAMVAATPVVGEWTVDVIVRREGATDELVTFGVAVQEPSPAIVAPPQDTGVGLPAPLASLWALLPPGAAGWIPVGAAVAAVLIAGGPRRQPRGLQPALAAIAIVAFLAMGSRTLVEAANRPTAADLAPYAGAETGDPGRGRQIYLANCAACHGPDGAGDGPVRTAVRPAALEDRLPSMSDAEVAYRIVNGIAGTPMPAFAASLTEADRQDLVAYLRERWGEP